MKNQTDIQYDPQKIKEQYPIIWQSQVRALEKINADSYLRATGLSKDDPPELWRYALARSESLVEDERHQRWRHILGTFTFCDAVRGLSALTNNDALLSQYLSKLLTLSKLEPLTKAGLHENCRQESRFIVQSWIQCPLDYGRLEANFCFFSDLALAKVLYFVMHPGSRRFPPESLTTEPERIRKLCRSLGLIAADPAIIKDIAFEAGTFRFIPFKKAKYKGK